LVLEVVWPPAESEAAKRAYQQLAEAAAFNPRLHLGVQA
jgi:curved DNA-binding protein